MTKDEYLRSLRDNEVFQNVLKMASSDSEKRAIKAYAESFMMKFYTDVFEHVDRAARVDPDALKKAFLEIESDLITSGSAEDKR